MSLLYTVKEFDLNTCQSYITLGFKMFVCSWKWWNYNSGSDKTSIFIDNVLFTLHPLFRLIDTNTNAKEETNTFQFKH